MRTCSFFKLIFALIVAVPTVSFAQTPTPTPSPSPTPVVTLSLPPILGTIVSVRGDIYQVRQIYMRGVSRFLATSSTNILDRDSAPPSILKPGMTVIAYGQPSGNGAIHIKFLRASENAAAFSRWGVQVGVRPDPGDGPDWVQFGGVIKTISPLTVVDANKTLIPDKLSISGLKTVDYWVTVKPDHIMIGRKVYIVGSRRSSDILLADSVFLIRAPGNPGTIFAQILSISGNTLTVLPRFGADPVKIALSPSLKVERQLSLNPDSIKLHQLVTVWGGHSADSNDLSQLTAYVIMPGVGAFPAGRDVAFDDPSSAGRDITGIVESFSPTVLKTKTGETFIVTVPGQTPVASYFAASRSDLKASVQTMLVCTQGSGKSTQLIAQTVVIDASPVVAMGF